MPNYSSTPLVACGLSSTERTQRRKIHQHPCDCRQPGRRVHRQPHDPLLEESARRAVRVGGPGARGCAEEQHQDGHAERRSRDSVGRLGRRPGGIPARPEQQELGDDCRSAGAMPAAYQIDTDDKQDHRETDQPRRGGASPSCLLLVDRAGGLRCPSAGRRLSFGLVNDFTIIRDVKRYLRTQ